MIVPTYGLAEHTVYVCSGGKQRLLVNKTLLEEEGRVELIQDENASLNVKTVIGCGYPHNTPDLVLAIVHPDKCERLEEGHVGEIWLNSPSKALGYYRCPELSTSAFHARIRNEEQGDEKENVFLRTGDLGFMYHNELFICGRIKDLIIIRGRNHYPQDLEGTVEAIPSLRPGCSAAFSITSMTASGSEEERLVVVAEVREECSSLQHQSILQTMRTSISTEHGLSLSSISLLHPHTIAKTTSGKIARRKCKLDYLNHVHSEILRMEYADNNQEQGGNLNVLRLDSSADINPPTTIAFDELPSPITLMLLLQEDVSLLTQVDLADVSPLAPLHDLGLDSLELTQFRGMLSHKYKRDVPEEVMYDPNTTLSQIHHVMLNPNDPLLQRTPIASVQEEPDRTTRRKKSSWCCCRQ